MLKFETKPKKIQLRFTKKLQKKKEYIYIFLFFLEFLSESKLNLFRFRFKFQHVIRNDLNGLNCLGDTQAF